MADYTKGWRHTALLNGERFDFKRFIRQPKRSALSSSKALEWNLPLIIPGVYMTIILIENQ